MQAPALAWKETPAVVSLSGPQRWYGWQFLIIDGAVLATTGILDAAGVHGDVASGLGLSLAITFDAGAPIVHAVHHRNGMAWASFGLRGALPLGALVSTLLLQPCRGALASRCLNSSAVSVSIYLALGAASALDASLLAWEGPDDRDTARASFEWTPTVAPRPDGLTVGILGAF